MRLPFFKDEKNLGVPIIYEDKSLLVVDKPYGLVVNNAESVKVKTLQDLVEDYYGVSAAEEGIGGRGGIVHRLDKGTSGLIIVAKTLSAFENLQAQFKSRQVKKEYTALVHGEMPSESGLIDAPIARNPRNPTKFAVVEGGRDSVTGFQVLSVYSSNDGRLQRQSLSLLRLRPKTGRTHQLRVHLAALGNAVVADEIYAGRKKSRADREWCPRMFLHATKISFVHPESGKEVTFGSELPEDLQEVLDSLERVHPS